MRRPVFELLEDRALLAVDWGDAPDPIPGNSAANYHTILAEDGPRHTIVDGLRIGSFIDMEFDAARSIGADGDDLNSALIDDEDGIANPAAALSVAFGAQPAVNVSVTNTTGVAATLFGWIDFNSDGAFDNSTERASVAVPNGSNNATVTLQFSTVPATYVGTTYARFRLSTDVLAANPIGHAASGEVEDYRATIVSTLDLGDAPDATTGTGPGNYNTRTSDNGPSHTIVAGLRMGPNVDADNLALQNALANADDVQGALPDDEDSLNNPAADLLLTVGAQPTVNVLVTNTTGSAATLYGWIDYNANGVFENATERASIAVSNGTNNSVVTLTFPAFPTGFTGETYARFRLSTDVLAAHPTGPASDGEVEDYAATIMGWTQLIVDSSKTTLLKAGINGVPSDANQVFGAALAWIGDLDDDGVDDLAAGAPLDGTGGPQRGAVYVLFMNADGTVKNSRKIAHNLNGGPPLLDHDNFGRSIETIGDLDGDGVQELAVGTDDDTGGLSHGSIYVLFMNADGTVKNRQKIGDELNGGPILTFGAGFGSDIASLGDLNGDGIGDLAVGAFGEHSGAGAAYILLMNADGTAKDSHKIANLTGGGPTILPFDLFGQSIASLGDIDSDGITDVAIGAAGDDLHVSQGGAIYIFFLNANGTVKTFQKIASGVGGGPTLMPNDFFGTELAFPGDMDGDGANDLLASSQDARGGAVYLLLLNADGTTKSSQKIASGIGGAPTLPPGEFFGSAIESIRDFDRDGFADLAISSQGGGGTVYLLSLIGANPVFTSPSAINIAENTTVVLTVTAIGADVPPQPITFSIDGGADQAKFSITTAGVLTFVTPPDFEMPTDAGTNNIYELTVQADDGNGGMATQTINITVTPTNDDAPEFTSPTGFVVPENTTAVATITAVDADLPPQALTFSLVALGDHAAFDITPGGAVTFKSPPDFEAPTDSGNDNVYNIVIQASDGAFTTSQAIDVTVTPLDDNVLAFISGSEFIVVQGNRAVGTVIAGDADMSGLSVTYALVGGADQSKFGISSDGLLAFLAPPSFAMPMDANGDNKYVVVVEASGGGQTATQTITVQVLVAPQDLGDAPDPAPGAAAGNYNTRVADNGPRHTIAGGLRLGAAIDGDNGLLENGTATADDVNAALPDDEDGLANPTIDLWLTAGTHPTVNVHVTNMTGNAATLWGWIDYNANGVFDNATERTSVAVPTGTNNNGLVTLVFPAVLGSFTGDTFSRFRLSTDADASDPTGEAADGEVEDYPATITRPSTGQADPGRNKKIASGTSGGPVLANGDMFGSSVASIGDLDGDGIPDFVVGAPVQFGASSGGKAYVLFMNADGTVKSSQEIGSGIGGGPALMLGDYFGHSVASIGDLDGDGIGDLAVGADKDDVGGYNRGAVHVLFMNVNGTVKASAKIANGTGGGPLLANGDRFGSSISSLGDLDGDGLVDLAVGATGDGPYRGAVHILFMNANGTVKTAQKIASGVSGGPTLADFDEFGIGAASLGDLDGDGVTELAVGAFRDDTGGVGRGAVHVLFMNANGTVKSSTKIASGVGGGPTLQDGDYFGRSVGALGDLDGDGIGDLAVGAYRDDADGTSRGALHVLFLNANGTVKRSDKITQGSGGGPALANDDRFGSGVAAIGDLDGDGVVELAVGAETDRTGGISRGAVHVLFLIGTNTNPVFTSPPIVNAPENSTTVHTITASDADFPPQTVTFTIVGGADQSKFALSLAGTLSFVAPPDFETPTDSNGDNVYVVTVQANDGNGGTATQTIGVFVDPVNDNVPVVTSPATANVAENTTAVMTVTATDADLPPQLVTFSLAGGADQSKFAITPAGTLTFISPPDFEAPTDADTDNVYVVIVQASDGAMTSVQTIMVTVTPANDNSPVFTSPANVNVPENTTAITTVTATDADLPAETVTFSIVGGADQALFSITAAGALSFASSRDFEMPADADGNNLYVVTIEASDGNGRTTSRSMNVTVSPVNDNSPVITSQDTASVPENTTSVLTVTATDADLPQQALFVSIVGGADQSRFAMTASGALSFVLPPNFEAPTDSNGDNVYVVIVQASDGGLTGLQAILITVTDVNEPPVGLVGDYNSNGMVDAADYVLWRKGGPLQNDPTPGVQPEDYNVWRANFGRTATSGASLTLADEFADTTSQAGESTIGFDAVPAAQKEIAEGSVIATSSVLLADSPWIADHRPVPRERLVASASRDNALMAWLALQSVKVESQFSEAFDDPILGAVSGEDPDQSADALELAFATLWESCHR